MVFWKCIFFYSFYCCYCYHTLQVAAMDNMFIRRNQKVGEVVRGNITFLKYFFMKVREDNKKNDTGLSQSLIFRFLDNFFSFITNRCSLWTVFQQYKTNPWIQGFIHCTETNSILYVFNINPSRGVSTIFLKGG